MREKIHDLTRVHRLDHRRRLVAEIKANLSSATPAEVREVANLALDLIGSGSLPLLFGGAQNEVFYARKD